MANGWTLERRQRQAELIRSWRPWEKSTGPKTAEGKQVASQNGRKHGQDAADWLELRRQLNQLLREERRMLGEIKST